MDSYRYLTLKENDEIWSLYENAFPPAEYKEMRKHYKKKGQFFSVCMDGDKIVGAMAAYKEPNNYLFVRAVVHPDYRKKLIGTSVRYMIIKHCLEAGADVVAFVKVDNELSHKRFARVGFRKIGRQAIFTYYLAKKEELDMEKLEKIWSMIENGEQEKLIKFK